MQLFLMNFVSDFMSRQALKLLSQYLREYIIVKCLSDFSRNTIFHLAHAPACLLLSSYHTSICSIEFNAKVSIRSTGVVAGSEDYPTNGFVFPDHAGDGRCGHYPVVSNDQATHLRKCHTGVLVSWLAGVCILIYLSGAGEISGLVCYASS